MDAFGYTYRMPDAQTIYELRLASHKTGCPVCTLIHRAGTRYMEGIFNESMLDPVVRQKLVKSLGFCYNHTWQSINLKLSDALGHAILYQDLVKDAIKKIAENEQNPGSQLTSALEPLAACPACLVEEAALDRILDTIAVALRNEDFVTEFKQSSGLCIPHLQHLLPKLDRKKQATILDFQSVCLENLKGELAEFIRKSDYRFRDESIGKEGDSYKRAADMIHGKRQPTEKMDLS
jgi:hypothetical protein